MPVGSPLASRTISPPTGSGVPAVDTGQPQGRGVGPHGVAVDAGQRDRQFGADRVQRVAVRLVEADPTCCCSTGRRTARRPVAAAPRARPPSPARRRASARRAGRPRPGSGRTARCGCGRRRGRGAPRRPPGRSAPRPAPPPRAPPPPCRRPAGVRRPLPWPGPTGCRCLRCGWRRCGTRGCSCATLTGSSDSGHHCRSGEKKAKALERRHLAAVRTRNSYAETGALAYAP